MKLISTNRKIENEYFIVTAGTTNKKRPSTFYIELNCLASLLDGRPLCDDIVCAISSDIKKIASSIVSDYSLRTGFISDVIFSEESLKNGKDTHFTIQFHFAQVFTTDFNLLCDVCEKIVDKYSKIIKDKLSEYKIEIRKSKKHD